MKAILIGITLSGALIALVFARLCFGCLKKKRRFAALRHGFFGLLFTCVAALFGLVQVSTLGYRALVHETKVARLEIKPRAAAQQFEATIYVDDQPPQVFLLAGDDLGAHLAAVDGYLGGTAAFRPLPVARRAVGGECAAHLFACRVRFPPGVRKPVGNPVSSPDLHHSRVW